MTDSPNMDDTREGPKGGAIGSKVAKLGEYIQIKHGFAFEGRFFGPTGTHVVTTPGNFHEEGGFRRKTEEKWFSGPIPEGYVLRRGDMIVAMTEQAEGLLGSAALVPEDGLYLHNQRLGLVRARNGAQLCMRYLYYLFNSSSVRRQIQATSSGTKIRHTSPARIEAVTVRVPGMDEQIRVAEALGSLDDKIELNRQTGKTLEELARSIFKAWFVDFLPVKAKAASATSFPGMSAEMFSDTPNQLRDDPLGEIPQGWDRKPLNGIAHFLNGLAMQKYPPREGKSVPVIKIAEMKRGVTESSDQAGVYLDKKFLVEDGDLLFSWSGSLDTCLWTGGPGALNQHLFKVTSDAYPQWFYYRWLNEHLATFQATALGKATTMGHIQRNDLQRAMCAIPPPQIMEVASKVLTPLHDLIIRSSLEIRSLACTRDFLLRHLLPTPASTPKSESG